MKVPASADSRVSPAGRADASQSRARSGRPASKSAIVPSTPSPTCAARPRRPPSRSPAGARPSRGTRTRRHPGSRISAMPTARRCRSVPGVPGGNAERRISSRNRRPLTGAGRRTTPSAPDVDRRRGAGLAAQPDPRRLPDAAAPVERQLAQRRPPTHSIHTRRPACQEPIQGRGVPSKALDARYPGRPWKRADELKRAREADERVERRVGRRGRGGDPAVQAPVASDRRREDALQAALAVPAVAHEHAGRGPVPGIAAERVVARRALEDVRSARRRSRAARARRSPAAAAPRSPARRGSSAPGCRAVIVGPGSCSTTIRTASEGTPRSLTGSRFQPARVG